MITRDINKKTWLAIIDDPAIATAKPSRIGRKGYTAPSAGIIATIPAIPFLQFRIFGSVLDNSEVDHESVAVVRSLITGLPVDAWKRSYWWLGQFRPIAVIKEDQ